MNKHEKVKYYMHHLIYEPYYSTMSMSKYEPKISEMITTLYKDVMNNKLSYKAYKKRVEKIERKERKRIHNKKKSDRMKKLRVKKEKKIRNFSIDGE